MKGHLFMVAVVVISVPIIGNIVAIFLSLSTQGRWFYSAAIVGALVAGVLVGRWITSDIY